MTDFNQGGLNQDGPEMPIEFEVASPPSIPEMAPKRKGRVIALAIGLVAVVGAGSFAVTQLGSNTDGADSPRAALDQMVSAINSSDILGVLEALPPGERSAIIDPIKTLNSELQRVGIVSKDNDLRSFKGASVKITDIKATTTELSSDVAAIELSDAKVSSTYDQSKLPIGDELKKLAFKDKQPTAVGSKTSTNDKGAEPVHLIAIKEGGGWHISLFYSIADNARRSAKLENPQFGKGVPAVGGDTPESAAKDMLNAIGALDVKRLIELMPPDEMRALHDYAPLFLDKATKSIHYFKLHAPFTVSFDGTEFGSTISNDVATVTVKKFAVAGKIGDVAIKAAMDGTCLTGSATDPATGEDKKFNSCDVTNTPEYKKAQDSVTDLHLNKFTGGLVFINRDGKWFFSPTRTTLGVYVSISKMLNADTFNKGIKAFQDLLTSNPVLSSVLNGLTTAKATATKATARSSNPAINACYDAYYALPSTASQAEMDAALKTANDCIAAVPAQP